MAGMTARLPLVRFVLVSVRRVALHRTTREALEPAVVRNDPVAKHEREADPWQ
jgi:hypothetical protein